VFLASTLVASLAGQVPHRTKEQISVFEVHKSDFDYLLGDKERTAVNHPYGRM
jgi:hypothetical protein